MMISCSKNSFQKEQNNNKIKSKMNRQGLTNRTESSRMSNLSTDLSNFSIDVSNLRKAQLLKREKRGGELSGFITLVGQRFKTNMADLADSTDLLLNL